MEKKDQKQAIEYNNKDELLEYLMRRFGDKVMQLAYSYLRDRDEAEDAAQEVFLRVYKSLDRFKGKSNPFTWIYAITVNLCRDRLRKKHFFKWEYLGEENVTLSHDDPERQALLALEGQTIFEAVLDLPVAYREMIVLHYLNELSIKEISAITGINPTLIKVRLYRGRKKLQKILEDRGIDYGS